MSFLLIEGRPVAYLFSPEPSGPAMIAFQRAADGELIDLQSCTISNAERWERWAEQHMHTLPDACLMGKCGAYREFYAEVKLYMNIDTGSVDSRAGWWYVRDGDQVNAVDLGEVVEVTRGDDGEWCQV